MANFPSFDEHYRPRLQSQLEQNVVNYMEQKINQTKEMNDANEAERLLDEACDQCIDNVKDSVEEIKSSVKQKGVKCTSPEDRQRYALFVREVTTGIHSTQTLFDNIFSRVRSLVTTVVDWIRRGVGWAMNIITDTFAAIRSFCSN